MGTQTWRTLGWNEGEQRLSEVATRRRSSPDVTSPLGHVARAERRETLYSGGEEEERNFVTSSPGFAHTFLLLCHTIVRNIQTNLIDQCLL
jgi:hypothetical protein